MFGTRDVLIAYSNLQLECLLATRALMSAAGATALLRSSGRAVEVLKKMRPHACIIILSFDPRGAS
jgi:hypothetical protein